MSSLPSLRPSPSVSEFSGSVTVVGVNGGGKEDGEELARERAEVVVDYLIAHGVPATRLSADVKVGKAKKKDKGRVDFVVGGGK